MNNALRPLLRATLLSMLVVPSTILLSSAPAGAVEVAGAHAARSSEASQTWIVDKVDNICGLDDAKTLSNPVKVDYDALLKATPEYKKIKDEKIDVNSAEGIQLRQKAAERVRDASEKLRVAKGYCSVWKTIKHADGRSIPDVTDAVKAQL